MHRSADALHAATTRDAERLTAALSEWTERRQAVRGDDHLRIFLRCGLLGFTAAALLAAVVAPNDLPLIPRFLVMLLAGAMSGLIGGVGWLRAHAAERLDDEVLARDADRVLQTSGRLAVAVHATRHPQEAYASAALADGLAALRRHPLSVLSEDSSVRFTARDKTLLLLAVVLLAFGYRRPTPASEAKGSPEVSSSLHEVVATPRTQEAASRALGAIERQAGTLGNDDAALGGAQRNPGAQAPGDGERGGVGHGVARAEGRGAGAGHGAAEVVGAPGKSALMGARAEVPKDGRESGTTSRAGEGSGGPSRFGVGGAQGGAVGRSGRARADATDDVATSEDQEIARTRTPSLLPRASSRDARPAPSRDQGLGGAGRGGAGRGGASTPKKSRGAVGPLLGVPLPDDLPSARGAGPRKAGIGGPARSSAAGLGSEPAALPSTNSVMTVPAGPTVSPEKLAQFRERLHGKGGS